MVSGRGVRRGPLEVNCCSSPVFGVCSGIQGFAGRVSAERETPDWAGTSQARVGAGFAHEQRACGAALVRIFARAADTRPTIPRGLRHLRSWSERLPAGAARTFPRGGNVGAVRGVAASRGQNGSLQLRPCGREIPLAWRELNFIWSATQCHSVRDWNLKRASWGSAN